MITDFESRVDGVYDLVIQPDGMVVAIGSAATVDSFGISDTNFAVARYTTTGTPDLAFGANGKVTTTSPAERTSGMQARCKATEKSSSPAASRTPGR